MTDPTPAAVANSRCAACGAPFRCGMEGGDQACWCASLPPLLPVPAQADPGSPAASCLCPACLGARLAQAAAARSQ